MKAARCLALALLLAACSDSTGTAGGVRVTTNASAYTLRGTYSSASVRFTVKNMGSSTIALPDCGGRPAAELQQLQGSDWVTVGGTICPAVFGDPLLLAPGESSEGFTDVYGAGMYRVRIMLLGSGDEEPARYVVSPTFVAR